ncbi:hypothetical protein N5923_21745 [Erwiniaceae bacterium BAC15a-03b]|uniref:Uncharacterized protein n=1 Tax=Winslowiella arboricola TaxID=2978220 RepID=A0A9J6Q1I8_9GAMM|nr:hypothetical protein [Winslowiella arboricola]MCU5774729.1 hypothetical protein [Winslowiella arboricola]MCU5780119.1 hypothetical protein [Winslowiella arboricola]
MRYYRLEIADKYGRPAIARDGTLIGPFDTAGSAGRGLHIDFDAMIAGYDVIKSGTKISLYGLPASMLSQSVQLNGYHLKLKAGFTQGLPLANPGQADWIISGEIYNCYANWIGTEQSLNFIVNPSPLLNDEGQSTCITLSGKRGDNLGKVVEQALKRAYPKCEVITTVSNKLVLPEDATGVCPRMEPLATTARSMSKDIINDDGYSGVQVVVADDVIHVFDNWWVSGEGDKPILPQELIGQPTWAGLKLVSFKCPLRADLRCGDKISLPKNILSAPSSLLSVNNEQANPMLRNNVNFSGLFLITAVRHVGKYLSADSSNAWVTNYEALAQYREAEK